MLQSNFGCCIGTTKKSETYKISGAVGSNCFGFQFNYDGWANLTATSILTGYTSCTATAPDAFGISVDGNNHLTTSGFTYDSSGNVLTDGVNTYAWNAESETKTAQGVTYTYDGLGNRVEKSNGTLYWYGPGGEVLDETNLTGSLTSEYVFFAGKRVARRDASGNIYYYAEDFIGSSRVITQSNGTLCSDADFLPFGQEVDYTSACGQNYKFEGKERDIETGNDNFGARYYRSALGRWMSPDWSAIPAPVPYANLTNPQTLNQYAMTSDNPETFADLNGHSGILAIIADPGGLSPDMVTGSDFLSEGTGTISANDTPPPEPPPATGPVNSPAGAQAQQTYGRQSNGSYRADPAKVQAAIDSKKPIGNGQCVAACSRLSGVTPHTASWTPGRSVLDLNDTTDVGLAIATFGPNGKFTQPSGDQNSAIYMGHYDSGPYKGQIKVVDQWPPPNAKQYNAPFEHPLLNHGPSHDLINNRMENNAHFYHVIIVP